MKKFNNSITILNNNTLLKFNNYNKVYNKYIKKI